MIIKHCPLVNGGRYTLIVHIHQVIIEEVVYIKFVLDSFANLSIPLTVVQIEFVNNFVNRTTLHPSHAQPINQFIVSNFFLLQLFFFFDAQMGSP